MSLFFILVSIYLVTQLAKYWYVVVPIVVLGFLTYVGLLGILVGNKVVIWTILVALWFVSLAVTAEAR